MKKLTEEQQKRVDAWEHSRFVYPNELGGIKDPWDENFMLTKEASKIWTGVQKKYFSKHRESLRTYQDVLIESQDRRWDKIKRDFGTNRLVEEPVQIRRFHVPLINPPDDYHCNVIIKDPGHGLGYRRCAISGGNWYKNRVICHRHERHIPCDVCWEPAALPCHVLSRPDRTYSGWWLGGNKKPFANTHIWTYQFLVMRFYSEHENVSDFNVVTGEYWLCVEWERALEKSLTRRRKKLALIQAVEKRDIRRAKQTFREVKKLIRNPKYRRQIQTQRQEKVT